jgi:hypothetical protein
MAKRPDLSKLTDAQYKALTPEQLLDYNKQLPEVDYSNPYQPSEHPYPSMRFALVDTPSGKRLRTARVNNEAEDKALGEGWEKSLLALGIETAPAAAAVQTEEFEINLPPESEHASAASV